MYELLSEAFDIKSVETLEYSAAILQIWALNMATQLSLELSTFLAY